MAGKLHTPVNPSILRNYRDQYKAKFGEEWEGSDEALTVIIKDAPVAESSKEQDEWVVDDMSVHGE